MKKLLFLFIVSGFLVPLSALALVVSPARQVISLEAGETAEFDLTVANNEKQPLRLQPFVSEALANSAGLPVFDDTSANVNWVKADWNNLYLNSGDRRTVKFFITAPAGSYPGDYYFGLGAETFSSARNNVSIGERVNSILDLKIAGRAQESLTVNKWQPRQRFYFNNDWLFDWQLKNTGNVLLPVTGRVVVKNSRGSNLFEEAVGLGNKIIPASIREAELEIKPDVFWPGVYQVNWELDYGLTHGKVVAVAWVWYCPFFWLVELALGVAVLVLLYWFVKKRRALKL